MLDLSPTNFYLDGGSLFDPVVTKPVSFLLQEGLQVINFSSVRVTLLGRVVSKPVSFLLLEGLQVPNFFSHRVTLFDRVVNKPLFLLLLQGLQIEWTRACITASRYSVVLVVPVRPPI